MKPVVREEKYFCKTCKKKTTHEVTYDTRRFGHGSPGVVDRRPVPVSRRCKECGESQ